MELPSPAARSRLGKLGRVRFEISGFQGEIPTPNRIGQLGDLTGYRSLTGYHSQVSNRVFRTLDTALHVHQGNWPTLVVGLVAIAVIVMSTEKHRFVDSKLWHAKCSILSIQMFESDDSLPRTVSGPRF